ncbi:MAG: tetratricopeptide repeat protein [Bacteroidota bacterium]
MRGSLLIFLLGAAASAQPQLPGTPASAGVAEENPSYFLANQLLENGQIEQATALLEDLAVDNPESIPIWLKLKEAYTVGRQYEALADAASERIDRSGPTLQLHLDRGTALQRANRSAEAEADWVAAVAIAPNDEQTYRLVANAIGQLRLFERAAEVLEAGRQRFDDQRLFRLELAHLYGLALDYERSAELYLSLAADDASYQRTVQSRMTRMLSGQGAPEIFAAAIARATAQDPLNRTLRELQSWLALEQGDYGAALDAMRALDRLENEQGESLYRFAERARAADAPEAAAAALDEILTRHGDGPTAPAALLLRARIWHDQAREARERFAAGPTPNADRARETYQAFLTAHTSDPSSASAALALATLLRDVYGEFEASEARLAEAASGRDQGVAATARLALGDVALRRGDLDEARQRYIDVDEQIRVGPLAEQARYELALLDFYEGFMFSALARTEALDENTAADATNDAISLRVTLNEVLDPEAMPPPDADLTTDPLHIYARAALRQRRGLLDQALATLDTLDAGFGRDAPLGDESIYLRATILSDLGRAQEAVDALDQLAALHPLSFFLDRALRLQARLLEADLGDPAGAATRWDLLLESFPGSPLAPEARQELRRLRSSA